MIDIRTVKLIIWDLDDTFWKGTISEGEISIIDENIQFLKDLSDCGIINSICSKNDADIVNSKLKEIEIENLFVFNSINWGSKSIRLKDQIEQMSLRPQNVLFIDDNLSNLGEAKHILPDIQICEPSQIPTLIKQLSELPKVDINHKRLQQYKVLEKKRSIEKTYSSNEEFLYASDIRVEICTDCINEIDRIHELVLRSNQLNFTKKRDSIEDLTSLINQKDCKSGYVKVKDKFGDYGIVGFYAIIEEKLVHFVFSCRTIGQGIEQYVYGILGFPKISIVGEVRTELNNWDIPHYINQQNTKHNVINVRKEKSISKILLKGPCDLSHTIMYLPNSRNIIGEFTYVRNGTNQTIDAFNHSAHIEGLITYSEKQINEIINDCPFVDEYMFNSTFFSGDYDFIFLSSLIEPLRGVYRLKGTAAKIAFGSPDYPLTDKRNWNHILAEELFTRETLESFSNKYEYLGTTTPELYVSFLRKCLTKLKPNTTLCIILGSTFKFPGCERLAQTYAELNYAIKEFSRNNERLKYIEIDNLISSEHDFVGHLNHFTSEIYYKLAQEISFIICDKSGPSRTRKLYIQLLLTIRNVSKRLLKPDSNIYSVFQKFYYFLSNKKDIHKR